MEELVAKIAEAYASFIADANLQAEKGNKAAGTRARKTSLAIEKLLKEFPQSLHRRFEIRRLRHSLIHSLSTTDILSADLRHEACSCRQSCCVRFHLNSLSQ